MSKHYLQKEPKQRHLKAPAPQSTRRSAKPERAVRTAAGFDMTKGNIIQTGAALALFVAACIVAKDGRVGLAAFAVPLLVALYAALLHAVEEVYNGNFSDDSIPAIIASVAVFAVGDYCGGAAIMVFYRAAKLIEAFARELGGKLNTGMKAKLPQTVRVEVERGRVEELEVQKVALGDIMLLDIGETVALDGVVVSGMSAVDISPLTASAENYTVTRGSRVFSGCVNTDAPIRVKVERLYDESTAYRVFDALENAKRFKSSFETRAEKLAALYAPVVAAAALITAVLPPILNSEWRVWIGRAGVLLALSNTAVFSTTGALCFMGGIAVAAGSGIVIKGTRFVEALARTKTMIFNKTGTITEGRYTVTDVHPKGMTDYDLLLTAACAEQYSPHPIARAICAACGSFERDSRENVKSETIPARGVSTVVRGKHIYVGNAALLEEHGIHCDVPRRGGAAIHVAVNGKYCGYFIMTDRVREGAFDALEELRVAGVKNSVLLTGDVRSLARPVASSLNFDMVKPELTPEGKISAVEYLLATKPERSALAVVSDRAGDADSLERADVGISIASLGAAAAIDSADVLIMADELNRLPVAVRTARLAYAAARQNALGFVLLRALLLPLAVCGALSALPAVLIDLGVSLLIFANAYRTFYKIKK